MTTSLTIYAIGMLFTLGFVVNMPEEKFSDEQDSWMFMLSFICAILLWPMTLGIQASEYMFHGDENEQERKE